MASTSGVLFLPSSAASSRLPRRRAPATLGLGLGGSSGGTARVTRVWPPRCPRATPPTGEESPPLSTAKDPTDGEWKASGWAADESEEEEEDNKITHAAAAAAPPPSVNSGVPAAAEGGVEGGSDADDAPPLRLISVIIIGVGAITIAVANAMSAHHRLASLPPPRGSGRKTRARARG